MGAQKPFYVIYLANELERRIQDNRLYSLRAFAHFLDIDASFLSKILSGKQVLSLKKAQEITEKLGITTEDRKKFLLSIAEQQKCRSLLKFDSDLTDCQN